MAEPPVAFAGVLRKLRTDARLTQEELAAAAGLSLRAVSDLERSVVTTPHKDTVRLLADALHLIGPARAEFEAAARGRVVPAGTGAGGAAAATRTLPRDIASFTGRHEELRELVEAAAGTGGTVSIHAIGGMAGVGKTAFAARDLEEALGLYRDLGNRGGEVTALNEAGTLSRVRGDLRQAGSCHQQALDLARQIGSSWDEAHALAGLGRCALAASRTVEAEGMLRQAVAIFQRIGAAETADVSAELDALTAARPTSHES